MLLLLFGMSATGDVAAPVVPVGNNPGGRFVGGHWSKGKWRALQEELEHERQQKRRKKEKAEYQGRTAAEAKAEAAASKRAKVDQEVANAVADLQAKGAAELSVAHAKMREVLQRQEDAVRDEEDALAALLFDD
jgi:hypothetical protein